MGNIILIFQSYIYDKYVELHVIAKTEEEGDGS